MSENILVLEILHQIDEALQKVKRRFENINTPDDFLDSEYGLDMLDAICMKPGIGTRTCRGTACRAQFRVPNSKLRITNYEFPNPNIKFQKNRGVLCSSNILRNL